MFIRMKQNVSPGEIGFSFGRILVKICLRGKFCEANNVLRIAKVPIFAVS